MFCTKCGKKLPDNANFCKYCGNKVLIIENLDKGLNKEKNAKKSGRYAIIAILMTVILLLSSVIVYLNFKKQDNIDTVVLEGHYEYNVIRIKDNEGLYGLMDTEGNIVAPCIYEEIEITDENVRGKYKGDWNKIDVEPIDYDKYFKEKAFGYKLSNGNYAKQDVESGIIYFYDKDGKKINEAKGKDFVNSIGYDLYDRVNRKLYRSKDEEWEFYNLIVMDDHSCFVDDNGDYIIEGIQDYDGIYCITNVESDEREKMGCTDVFGNQIFEYKYDSAFQFVGGLATVEQNEKKGYVNSKGEEIIECKYDSVSSFSEGLASVILDGKWGYINSKGEEIIEFKYYNAEPFSEGLAALAQDGRYGYINSKGEEIIEFKYDETNSFHEGLASVIIDGKYGYINTKGEEIVPCKYDFAYDFSEGLAEVVINEKHGCINSKGEEIVSCKYDSIDFLNKGLARVKINGKSGYINSKGEEIVSCKYDFVDDFHEGLARVEMNGKSGYINSKGEEIIPCQYVYDIDPFSQLSRIKGDFNEGLASIERDGKWGYINSKGEEIIPCQYDFVWSFDEGLAKVKQNDKYGYINSEGEEIIKCKYDDIEYMRNNVFLWNEKDEFGLINNKGEELIRGCLDDSGYLKEINRVENYQYTSNTNIVNSIYNFITYYANPSYIYAFLYHESDNGVDVIKDTTGKTIVSFDDNLNKCNYYFAKAKRFELSGNTKKAKKYYQKAAEYQPDNELLFD